jgi:hypothetical protein
LVLHRLTRSGADVIDIEAVLGATRQDAGALLTGIVHRRAITRSAGSDTVELSRDK